MQHGWGHERFPSPALRGRKVGGALSLSAQVEALLAGVPGAAWDPSETVRLFQLSGGTGAVTVAADPVGYHGSKFGTVTRNFIQATAGFRPAWDGVGGVSFDGTDDFLELSPTNVLQNVAAAFFCGKFNITSLAAARQLIYTTTNSAANHRFAVLVNTNGSIVLQGRRLDADALQQFTSVVGVITAGTPFVVSAHFDYAGTGDAKLWVNGVEVVTATLSGSPANSSNTASTRGLLGIYDSGANRMLGKAGRFTLAPLLPSSGDRLTFESWANEVAL